MQPFENDHEAMSLSGLSVENSFDVIVIHGSLEVARDQRSLKRVEALEALLGDIKAKLLTLEKLPEVALSESSPGMVDVVANPFDDN